MSSRPSSVAAQNPAVSVVTLGVGVGNGQEGTRTPFGLVDQFGMAQEQLAEQLGAFGGGEPVERGGGCRATRAHAVGQAQPGGRRARNDGRPSQVR